MKLKKIIILFFIFTVIETPFNVLCSQAVQRKPTRQSSFEAFSQGNYEKAYVEFSQLLLTYSKDPLYKYYSGVCLVKLKNDPGKAMELLQEALQGTGVARTLPFDGYYYLGRAQQMSGKFSEAAESYNLFTDKAGKKSAKELGIPDLIQQCLRKEGQVIKSGLCPADTSKKEVADQEKNKANSVLTASNNSPKEVKNGDMLPENYDVLMAEAIEFQFKADSVTNIIFDQKKNIEKLSPAEKISLKAKIAENEKIASWFQKNADMKYTEAKNIANPPTDSVKRANESMLSVVNNSAKDSSEAPVSDALKSVEKLPVADKINLTTARPIIETYSFFEVMAKPVNDPKGRISIDPEVPAGLIYRIQIAVFRNPVLPEYFKGMTPVFGFRLAGTDKTAYYAGMFRRYADAAKALVVVKSKGFKDAFIIALMDKKAVSGDRAAFLEKEWCMKPFTNSERSFSGTLTDTIPRTLLFRVEVIQALKPLKEDVVEGMKKIAGNNGLDIFNLNDGKKGYYIGKFITFETAAEYCDLLKRNGYRESQVSAWLGNKQIPIETARQLVENAK